MKKLLSKILFVTFAAIILLSTLVGSCGTCNVPAPKKTTSVTKEITVETSTETKEGLADTTEQLKIQNEKLKVKKNEIISSPEKSSSTFKKVFAKDKDTVTVTVKTIPAVDEAEIEIDSRKIQRTVTRVDTVFNTTRSVEKIVETTTEEIVELPKWLLTLGTEKTFYSGFEPEKYLQLSYNHKVWFVYITVKGGVNNRLNAGLEGIKTHGQIELSVPLW
jgi:hypothetical protein